MIYIASDHKGFEVKKEIKDHLYQKGLEFTDLGPLEFNPVDDYPLFAFRLAEEVVQHATEQAGKNYGILICSSGAGMTIAANKVKGSRAVFVNSINEAILSKEHNNANILVLDMLTFDPKKDFGIIDTWLDTPFSNEERHVRRLSEIEKYEEGVYRVQDASSGVDKNTIDNLNN